MKLSAFLLIMTGVGLEVLAQVAFKRGAIAVVQASGKQGVLGYWHDLARNAWIQAGVWASVIALLIWIAALSFVPLSIAFPIASLGYCGVAIAGHFWLGEKLGRRSVAGIAMITIGAALVCLPWS